VRQRVPLTVCPLSNVRLRAVDTLDRHPLAAMLAAGILCTVNSDDPAYFGGYAEDNFDAVRGALTLSDDQLRELARNSFHAAFLEHDEPRRARYLAEVEAYEFPSPPGPSETR
jgi:adenosine deaminase